MKTQLLYFIACRLVKPIASKRKTVLSILLISVTITAYCGGGTETIEKEDNIYYVEEMPSFPGGENAMRDFINRNLKYPKAALDNGIQGRVFVSFTIEKDGKISNVKVVKSVGGGLDEEAVRIVKLMPNWRPGRQKGENVSVAYTIPMVFKISK